MTPMSKGVTVPSGAKTVFAAPRGAGVPREELVQVGLDQTCQHLAHQQHALLVALDVVEPARVAAQGRVGPDHLARH